MSFEARVDRFLRAMAGERAVSRHTITAYRADLEAFVRDARARGRVGGWEAVSPDDVRVHASEAQRSGLSPRSVARRLSALRSFFRYGCLHGWFAANPAAGVRGKRAGRPLPRALDETDLLRVLRAAPRVGSTRSPARWARVKAFVELAYGSGLRASEALALRWIDIDVDEGVVTVAGKGNKERVVPVGRHALRALALYRAECGPVGADAPVFVTRRGRLSSRQLAKDFAELTRLAAVGRPVTPHTLRHSFATQLLERGADPRFVQELLGHARLTTTETYTRITAARLRKAYAGAHPRA